MGHTSTMKAFPATCCSSLLFAGIAFARQPVIERVDDTLNPLRLGMTDDATCPIGVVLTGRSIWDTTNYPNQPNPRPVIGVLTQDCVSSSGRIFTADCTEDVGYVSAGYVKWLEASGALVHIVPMKIPAEELTSLLQNDLSGLLIPGSGSYKPFYQASAYHAIREVLAGNVDVPIFGTCMGMEIMAKAIAEDEDMLVSIEGTDNAALPMKLVQNGGRIFDGISPDLENALATQNITMNAHHYGITPDQAVNGIVVTGTSTAPDGTEFVAAMEHESLPLFGVQWHPEKANFEFPRSNPQRYDDTGIHQQRRAVEASQFVGNFFLETARQHRNRYTQLDKYLSYSMNSRRVT